MASRHALRSQLIVLGAAGALAAGPLVFAPPASAATTLDYTCVQSLAGLPVGETAPVSLSAADSLTVPLGGTLPELTATLGLDSLVDALGTTVTALVGDVQDLEFELDGVTATGVLSGGSVSIPAFPVPASAGDYALTAPEEFVITTVGGLLGTVTCTLDGTLAVLTTLTVAPAAPGGGSTGGTTTPPTASAPTAANPCTRLPAVRAGQRRTTLKVARPARVSARKKAALAVSAKVGRRPVRGRVIACEAGHRLGGAELRRGKVTLRVARLQPGRHRVKVVYLGGARARAVARLVTVRVRH